MNGTTATGDILTVVFTWRHHGEEKVCRVISAAKLVRKSEADIQAYLKSPQFTADAKRSRSFGSEPTAADLKEIPELTDDELMRMYRPIKTAVTVRVDGDVLAWLKSKGGRYQTHMNQTLRRAMLAERKSS